MRRSRSRPSRSISSPDISCGTPRSTARYALENAPSRICAEISAAARELRARTISPETGASSRCTVRMQSVWSCRRSSSGIPFRTSVEITPAGFIATTMRSS